MKRTEAARHPARADPAYVCAGCLAAHLADAIELVYGWEAAGQFADYIQAAAPAFVTPRLFAEST